MSTPRYTDKHRPPIAYDSMPVAPGTEAAVRREIECALNEALSKTGRKNTKAVRETAKKAVVDALERSLPVGVCLQKITVSDTGEVNIEITAHPPSGIEFMEIDLELSGIKAMDEEVEEAVKYEPPTFLDDLRSIK